MTGRSEEGLLCSPHVHLLTPSTSAASGDAHLCSTNGQNYSIHTKSLKHYTTLVKLDSICSLFPPPTPPRCFKGKLLRQEIPFFMQTLIPVFTRKQSTHKRRELLLLKSFLCKRVSLASRMMTLLSSVSQTRLSFSPISFLFSSREPFFSLSLSGS